jgi:hypothetical protein
MKSLKKLLIVSLLLLPAISVSAQKNLRIIATGELLVDWNWTAYDSCNKRIQSIVDCLDVAYPNYGKADLIGGNFEGFVDDGQMVTSWTPYSDDRTFHCAASDVIDSLMSVLGVNFICPVNNHAFDGEDIDDDPDNGRQGILQTKACLDARDILYAGIGNNMAEVKTPGVMTLDDGTTIGILCAGTNSNSDPPHATDSRAGMWHSLEGENGTASDYGFDRLVEAVETHSPNYDYFIVYTHQHWDNDGDGEGYIDDSEDEEFLEYFQAYIDAGANICINDGPHQPCGWDVYNGGLLLLSNGNFFYNTRKGAGKYPWKSWASYVTDILFVDDGNGNKEVGAIKFIPCYGNDIGTEGNPDGNDEQERLHFKSRGVPELTKGSNALDIFERVNDITDNDRSLMQSSDDGIEVVSDGDVHIGYWPSKQVFDSISGGVVPDTVKPTVTVTSPNGSEI